MTKGVLEKSYQITVPPEHAMTWDTYVEIVNQEWQALLANTGSTEKDFQGFFERHTCCLPQMYPVFKRGAHGPYPGAVISQPVLPGFSRKVPDFLYITRDSATVYAVLIEIEHPANPNGIPTQSPGLRGTSYPGSAPAKNSQPQRGCGLSVCPFA